MPVGESSCWNVRLGNILENMRTICTVEADLSGLYPLLRQITGCGGQVHWRVDFEICVSFGATELKAILKWKEGVSRLSLSINLPPSYLTYFDDFDDYDDAG